MGKSKFEKKMAFPLENVQLEEIDKLRNQVAKQKKEISLIMQLLRNFRIILDNTDWGLVKTWVPTDLAVKKPNLLYRASTDGFTSQAFHTRCDNKGATIAFVKTSTELLIGGFNYNSWNASLSTYVSDNSNKCFLFSMTKKAKYLMVGTDNNTFNHANNGPTFGSGCDLYIAADMRSNSNYSNKSSYAIPNNYDFSGAKNFAVIDLEVYNFI